MWRMDTKKMNYEFLQSGWNIETESIGESRKQLESRIESLLTTDHLLPYKAIFPELYNEHALVGVSKLWYARIMSEKSASS